MYRAVGATRTETYRYENFFIMGEDPVSLLIRTKSCEIIYCPQLQRYLFFGILTLKTITIYYFETSESDYPVTRRHVLKELKPKFYCR